MYNIQCMYSVFKVLNLHGCHFSTGSFCLGGKSNVSGLCLEGYYCPGGQNTSSPDEFYCKEGFKCAEGSSDQQPCEDGTYQNAIKQVTVYV